MIRPLLIGQVKYDRESQSIAYEMCQIHIELDCANSQLLIVLIDRHLFQREIVSRWVSFKQWRKSKVLASSKKWSKRCSTSSGAMKSTVHRKAINFQVNSNHYRFSMKQSNAAATVMLQALVWRWQSRHWRSSGFYDGFHWWFVLYGRWTCLRGTFVQPMFKTEKINDVF